MDCMCRVCETIYGLKNMFDEENEELLLMLRSVANISIYPNDFLPKYICEFCSHKLQKTYDFKVQCETTDQKLREMLEYLTKPQIVASVETTINEDPLFESKDNIKHEIEILATKQQPTKPKSDAILIIDSEDEDTMKNFSNFDDMISDENDEFSEEDEKEKIFEEEMKKLFENASIIHRKKKPATKDMKPEPKKVEEYISEQKDDASMTYEEIFINGENLDDLIIEDYSEDIGANDSTERVQNVENNSEVNNQVITKEERDAEPVEPVDSTKEVLSSSKNDPGRSNTPSKIIKEPRVYKCAVCSEIFPDGSKLTQHKRKHDKWKNKCHICNKIFARKSGLTGHLLIHAGRKVTCDLCSAQLSNRGNLLRHIQQCHNLAKPFPCDICGVHFSRRSSVRIHRETHTDSRPFPCDKCGKSFRTKLYLTIHQGRHIPVGERTKRNNQEPEIYICPHCGKISTALPTHISHMKIHNDKKAFACQECPKKFHFKQTLINHMLVHTGEKPFKCEICGKAFRQQPHLKTHHRSVHLKARPFQCKYCKKFFSNNPNLRIHERLHTGERPFKCEECGQGFIEGKGLKKHKLSNKCKGPARNVITHPKQETVDDDEDKSWQTFNEDISDETKPGETQGQLQNLENTLGAELEIFLQDIHNDYAEIIEVES